ncbi:acetylxylan esterase [Microbacterium azadirachtae]|uniref:Cephalosporin-C deacetylase n=1 Tax=Microbacterium azadirachtae TaxID=582680 RepID=A0A0F0LNA6_9MICO|nr:acetylxylan esterase [Microbacterium azadirachtae]KJL33735.1 Cephalosporin-C deacetylase [Microbacterium azadirachtae]
MAQFDLPLDQLQSYQPLREEPADFDDFWTETLRASRGHGSARFTAAPSPLRSILVEDVTFPGFAGQPIKGWMLRPADGDIRATVVQYIGYSGGRGVPEQWTLLPSAGYAVLVMDSRGQGNSGAVGDTADPVGSGPQIAGRLSAGIEDPQDYYYRRIFTDAACAVDAARSHVLVDPDRVVVAGGSQGGGIALAAAGLCDGLAGAMIDVPFLSHFRRALRITDAAPYNELTRYMQTRRGEEDDVFRVLSYFDGVNFAARATARALFSVALCDMVCPPSTVYAAFNTYATDDKEMAVYPYNGHEGGQWNQTLRHLAFLDDVFS